LHALGVVARQIVLNPLIMSACAGSEQRTGLAILRMPGGS